MPAPLVSICMPAYNYGHFIEQAVRSAFAQTYRPLELVVVDDGSTDGTWEILERLAKEAPFPMKPVKGAHKGVSAALNLALTHATGEWVVMLHADDWAREDRIEKQVAAIAPGVTIVHSEYVSVDPEGKKTGYDSSVDLPPAVGDSLRDLLLLRVDVRSMTLMFHRQTLIDLGGCDETLPVEDWQSILRLSKAGRVAHVPEQLVFRRVHPNSVSFTSHRKKTTFNMKEIAFDVLRDVRPPDLSMDLIGVLHASVVIRNAIAMGAWKKVEDALRQCWDAFPTERARLLALSSGGFVSYAWVNGVRPRLPDSAIQQVLRLKRFLR